MPRRIAGLYAIADTRYLDEERLVPAVADVIRAGAQVVQYRDKSADAHRRERQAGALAALCRNTHTTFIVNDDVALARAVVADGVHLGRSDADVHKARSTLGRNALIGVSCYNELARALAAQEQGADYVAFGRFFPSRTKPQAVQAEIDLVRQARAVLRVPIVAIGGITPENGDRLIAQGADALAVIEGVFGQRDCHAAAASYARLFGEPGGARDVTFS